MDAQPEVPDYSTWSPEQLIQRVTALEAELRRKNEAYSSNLPSRPISPSLSTPKKKTSPFDPSKYSTRLVALKFAYLGAGYNGFEHHVGNRTPLPTVEEEVWKALVKCRLIFPPGVSEEYLETLNRPKKGQGLEALGSHEEEGMEGMVEKVPVDWEGCEYSKCGRTDKGVSAFGQVIGVRLRSSRPLPKRRRKADIAEIQEQSVAVEGGEGIINSQSDTENGLPPPIEDVSEEEDEPSMWDPIHDELPYIPLLNKVLPPTIRVLAWCPHPPPNFDARFSCKERQYRYFFTSPAFLPSPGPRGLLHDSHSSSENKTEAVQLREGYLDIEAMREAASYLEGSHDFRNFCKVDPSKQMDTFVRRITRAEVMYLREEGGPGFVDQNAFAFPSLGSPGTLEDNGESKEKGTANKPALYTFQIQGSAFLWHQVRCMVGILFLIGQRLEKPDLVKQLLDVSSNPRKPKYEMASDTPLVLWDCFFSTAEGSGKFALGEKPEGYVERGTGGDELEWVYAGEERGGKSGKWGGGSLMEDLWCQWRGVKMGEVLAGQLLDLVASQGPSLQRVNDGKEVMGGHGFKGKAKGGGQRVFEGDDTAKSRGKYVPVMKKEKMDDVEVINARYVERKGGKVWGRGKGGQNPAVE